MKLLTNKTVNYNIPGTRWFAPTKMFANKYASIKCMKFMEQTSSAGDWSGYFIQQIGKNKFVAIGFSQENNYPGAGFTLYTCEHPFYEGTTLSPQFIDNVESCWNQFAYDKFTGELN